MQQAIDYEIRWQIEQIEDGHAIQQATVLFDPDTGETRAMRTKEDAAITAYFPDPRPAATADLASPWIDESKRAQMPELPRTMAARFVRLRPARVRRDHAHVRAADGGLLFEATARPAARPRWPATGSWARCRAA